MQSSRIAICVPVRDEARTLPGLFKAIARQRHEIATVVVLLFDGCRDASRTVAERSAAELRIALHCAALPRTALPDAGRARSAALRSARSLIGDDGLLLGTDADTRPAPDWVSRLVGGLKNADMVCGRIERRALSIDRWRAPIEVYLDRLHNIRRAIDPVAGDAAPSHWHEGGANLGMTAAAWDRIAGYELPASGEDRALVRFARLAGLVVRQDPAVRVRTSSRIAGRAAGGLSDALRTGRAGSTHADACRMEHPADVVDRFRRSAIARAAYPPADFADLSARIAVPAEILRQAAASATSADAFATTLPLERRVHRSVPLEEASRLLAAYEADDALCR